MRWALDNDEKCSDSKSGASSNSGSAPGAYSVKPNSSDDISAGKLGDMWRKEGGHGAYPSVDEGGSMDENINDDTDEEEGMMAASSAGGDGSFAQFSVYGTALMCKQGDDMTITTDLYGTSLLMEDDATVTTDNRSLLHADTGSSSFLGQNYHGYIDEEEGLQKGEL